ncbi:LacI family DNA-binding transcriptional regulator [Flaviaesturariibacter amylovorans]|uniref:LacI family DNA-binding transcriptional regulator n=1 Tax=Flaviaesturariibacter amylovorans TaxID=1084520 RepID=A0ABP8H7Y2_9BACT
MAKKVTIHDIARELQVNAATVSRALNDHPAISARTKEAVRKVARRLHYQPNSIAASLRSGRSRILGVLIPSAEITFFGSVVHGIERVAAAEGYTVLIYQTNESEEGERKGVETFLRSRVDGVLASIAKGTRDLAHLQDLKRRGVPLVLFDRVSAEAGVPSVSINDSAAAFMATEHLLQQGYRRIAYISGPLHVPIWKERLKGHRKALKKYGLPADRALLREGDVSIGSGAACMEALLRLPEPPDAVCCVEDYTALGALQALRRAGIAVPGQVGIIGFANELFGQYIEPALSTIDQQTIRMGEEAARLFFELSAGKFYGSAPRHIVLEPQLIIRQSSVKIHTAS